jgi:hypothetical protein
VPNEYAFVLSLAEQREMLRIDLDDFGEMYDLPPTFEERDATSIFSQDELEDMRRVAERFKSMTVKELVGTAHQEPAWKETARAEIISYEHAFKLKS